MVSVLVVCGSGVATSTLASQKIKEFAKERRINLNIIQCRQLEAAAQAKLNDADLIVTTCYIDGMASIPIIDGKPLITDNGIEEFKKEFFSWVNKIQNN